jgi:UDP-N-acetylmuramoyl-tripeptide--D-alanyl-D-alanine ligase
MLVSRERREEAVASADGVPVFDVPDPLSGLQTIAAAYRKEVNPRVVAVTGSNGKTETKDLIAAILDGAYRVHATPGNLNNHIGLPLTLLEMDGGEEILVTEMGANHKGEIALLADIAGPEIGVVTNIGPSHLEFFGSLKGVAAAKSELVRALAPAGTAVLPADDEFIGYLSESTKARVVTFGNVEGADFRVEDTEITGAATYRFRIAETEIELERFGRHHIANAAAAFAVGTLFDVPAADIASAIRSAKTREGRGVIYEIAGITFIDDSYNSNPASLAAALEALMELPAAGRRWLILGDMLELGESSGELHADAGVLCGKAGVDGIFTLGDETVELNRAAAVQRKAPPVITHFMDAEKLAAHIDTMLEPGDYVLVKGSRGMRMERVMESIEGLRGAEKRRVN